jgi:hypothetical protein
MKLSPRPTTFAGSTRWVQPALFDTISPTYPTLCTFWKVRPLSGTTKPIGRHVRMNKASGRERLISIRDIDNSSLDMVGHVVIHPYLSYAIQGVWRYPRHTKFKKSIKTRIIETNTQKCCELVWPFIRANSRNLYVIFITSQPSSCEKLKCPSRKVLILLILSYGSSEMYYIEFPI